MNNRNLIILGIITAGMIAWAVAQAHISNKAVTEPGASGYLIQGLDPADIDGIVLGTGKDEVVLKRNGKQFVVATKDNYPAEPKDINSLIESCMNIKTEELYTDNASNHKDLGVAEDVAEYIVKFLKPNSELLVGVMIGKGKELGRGTFVRRIPGDKVYVTLERPWIKDKVMNYINRDLFSIDRENIESVTVSARGETYTLKPEHGDRNIIAENLPVGKKLKENDYDNVFAALKELRFEDVMKAPAPGDEAVFNDKYVCRLKDSTVYTITIAQKDDKTLVRCHAEFTDKTPVTKEEGIVESEEELKKKETKLLAHDKVNEFTARHNNWIYEISRHDSGNLMKQLSELYEEEEAEGEEPES